MNTKYIIEEKTLTAIADSIREMEGHNDPVPVEDFANRIGGIEPTTEDYMRISDFITHPKTLNELDYTTTEVNKCKQLFQLYLEMEDN